MLGSSSGEQLRLSEMVGLKMCDPCRRSVGLLVLTFLKARGWSAYISAATVAPPLKTST